MILTSTTSLMKSVQQKFANVFGLTAYESKIFLSLSTLEKGNVSQIALTASIPRTAVYPSIRSLLEKGLVSVDVVGKRKYYRALPPTELEALFEWKRRDLASVLEQISRVGADGEEPFQVLYFPGKMGLNSAAEIFLSKTKSKLWRTFETATVNQPALDFYQLQSYIDRRVARHIKAKVIITMNMMYPFLSERLIHDKEELRETVLIPEKAFPLKTVIGINEDSILVLSGENQVFGAYVKNVQLAEALATIHEMVWTRYKVEKEKDR